MILLKVSKIFKIDFFRLFEWISAVFRLLPQFNSGWKHGMALKFKFMMFLMMMMKRTFKNIFTQMNVSATEYNLIMKKNCLVNTWFCKLVNLTIEKNNNFAALKIY